MPNYEPTPRRFSIITVSRSASRRNSIDDSARPSLTGAHGHRLPDSPPPDLAAALRRLQHVEPEGEAERGRSRVVGGDKATWATWGHDGPMTAPSVRRGSSASTRERIVLWEERSRSQSKGRSKSRGRDVGSWHRVSVVPEVPELSAAFAVFDEEERMKVVVERSDTTEHPAGMEQNAVDDILEGTEAGEKQFEKAETEASEATQAWMTQGRQNTATPTSQISQEETASSGTCSSETGGLTEVKENHAERPTTPIRHAQQRPLTPEETPPPALSFREVENQKIDAEEEQLKEQHRTPETPEPPSTPPNPHSRRTPGAFPLTPDATPEQSRKSPRPGEGPVWSSNAGMYMCIFQPKDTRTVHTTDDGMPVQPQKHNVLPSEPFSEEPSQLEREHSPKPATPIPPKPAALPQSDGSPPEPGDARYHDVWRINSYRPEFPLSDRQTEHIDAQTLEQAPFIGNPLQELPRGQLPPEPRNHEANAIQAPYPYARPDDSRTGDWVVSIPPSPTAAYFQGEQTTRPPRARSRSRTGTERYVSRSQARRHEWDAPPVIERALHAASVSMMQGLNVPVEVYRGFRDTYYPAPDKPDIIKAYPVRRRLPVRIFFPSHHDLTSPALLPTLFTLHGGAFTVGSPADDDAWNRSLANFSTILVIALNYSKAPWAAFPTPLLDAEALYHAALNDESLPIDRMRTALAGIDAGANLALSLSQLPSVRSGLAPNRHHTSNSGTRCNPPPAAVISITGILDFTTTPSSKLPTRPYKPSLRGLRGWGPALDWTARVLPSSAWSYIPYGHDAADPLLSPAWAARGDLPPHVLVVGAELDCLAMESWRAACRWAGKVVPGRGEKVGRDEAAVWRGCLDDGGAGDGGRFGWTVNRGQAGSTRWLLVPDVVHGFESAGWRRRYLWGDEVARMDAEMKALAVQREVAEWLWGVVWRGGGE
ncbi:Arylacetamide deacetylase [Staphylotrichum tortipilum]|uniref:Arylacetamide deacetylase n=1 Tax=Staphylotrichum tortipilum TaxID=2831512 RepID=A0AAN6MMM7_9PEZI|nr:Arylacetamide deacetylase [Staphylotrichum longicolle]